MKTAARPYDDFDIAELNRYGREKGVALIGHHETGGAAVAAPLSWQNFDN